MPAHLRPITVEIPAVWDPEQALAVLDLLDEMRVTRSGPVTAAKRSPSPSSFTDKPLATTMTAPATISRSERRGAT